MTYISSRKDSCIQVCLAVFVYKVVIVCVLMTYFIPISPMNPESLIPATSLTSLLVTDPH